MDKRIIIIIICFLNISLAGNNAADFVATGLSARSLAMGNTFVSAGKGMDGVLQNPAAINILEGQKQFVSAVANNFDMVERKNIGFGLKDDKNSYGLMISNSFVGNIPKTSWGEDERPIQKGTFASEQYNYTLTYGREENEFFCWGFSIRNYSHKIAEYNATGVGLSAGIRYYLPEYVWDAPVVMGLAVHNIGRTKLIWSTGHSDTIPMRLVWGGSMYRELFGHRWVISSELEQEEGLPFVWRGGTEFWVVDNVLALRGGLEGKQLFYGVGLNYYELTIDYAQTEHEELGFMRRVSLGYLF